MIGTHPLRGVGAGGWNSASPLFLPENLDTENVWMAHNEAIQLVAEYGAAGWAALLGLGFLVFSRMRSIATETKISTDLAPTFEEWVALTSILSFAIVSLSGLPLQHATTCYALALSIGYLLATRRNVPPPLSDRASKPLLFSGRAISSIFLLLCLAISIQGMRSDAYMQAAARKLYSLTLNTSTPKDQALKIRTEAISELEQGLAIYSNHGLTTMGITSQLAGMDEPKTVIRLSNLMLETRPHVVALRCNIARARTEMGDFNGAGEILKWIKINRPNAACLPFSEFIYSFKQENFPRALALGQELISSINEKSDPATTRYVVDYSYRAAIRVPDINAAVSILKFRAERWPDLRAASWFLTGQLLAQQAGASVSSEALNAFKKALLVASNQERQALQQRVPDAYRQAVNAP